LFVVLGSGPVMEASLVTRSADGSLTCAGLFETVLRPLVGAPQPSSFRF
jgi:protein-L-isoaspartate(D-aspartate) O-methyltransferase